MKLSLILPICFLSIGCSSSINNGRSYVEAYTVDVDPIALTTDNAVINALQSWEEVSSVRFNIIIQAKTCDDSCNNEFTITSKPISLFSNIDGNQCGNDSCLCLTQFGATWANVMIGDVVVSETMGYPLQQLATHEVGHALGLIHTGAETVMCATQDCEAENITCQDLNQYNKLRNLPLEGCN